MLCGCLLTADWAAGLAPAKLIVLFQQHCQQFLSSRLHLKDRWLAVQSSCAPVETPEAAVAAVTAAVLELHCV